MGVPEKKLNIGRVAIPDGLNERVLFSVHAYESKRVFRQKVARGVVGVFSFAGCASALVSLYSGIQTSSAGEFLSLATTDFGTLVSLWKEMLFLFSESLPVFALGILCLSIAALLWSIVSTTNLAKPYSKFA